MGIYRVHPDTHFGQRIEFDAYEYDGEEYSGSYVILEGEPYRVRINKREDADLMLADEQQYEVAVAHLKQLEVA